MTAIPDDVDPIVFEAFLNMAKAEQAGNYEPAIVKLGPYTAFTLIGLLQLTWRHPGLSPEMKQIIENIARPLQRLFDPLLQEHLERGWDPAQDMPRN